VLRRPDAACRWSVGSSAIQRKRPGERGLAPSGRGSEPVSSEVMGACVFVLSATSVTVTYTCRRVWAGFAPALVFAGCATCCTGATLRRFLQFLREYPVPVRHLGWHTDPDERGGRDGAWEVKRGNYPATSSRCCGGGASWRISGGGVKPIVTYQWECGQPPPTPNGTHWDHCDHAWRAVERLAPPLFPDHYLDISDDRERRFGERATWAGARERRRDRAGAGIGGRWCTGVGRRSLRCHGAAAPSPLSVRGVASLRPAAGGRHGSCISLHPPQNAPKY